MHIRVVSYFFKYVQKTLDGFLFLDGYNVSLFRYVCCIMTCLFLSPSIHTKSKKSCCTEEQQQTNVNGNDVDGVC
jgi:hypothetical protein